MVTLSPVGLAAAPVANQVAFLATFKEKLCRCVCATSTNQPFATVSYRNETPVLNGTTVFVPIMKSANKIFFLLVKWSGGSSITPFLFLNE